MKRTVLYKFKTKIKYLQFRLWEFWIYKTFEDRRLLHSMYPSNHSGQKEVAVYLKASDAKPVFCRNNKVDYCIVHTTYVGKYHLPPKKLNNNAVIFDLGTNIGLTVKHLKYLYPDSHIIGVELDRDNFLQARKNLEGLNDIELINAAIWYKDGFVNYEGNDAQSFFATENTSAESAKTKAYSLMSLIKERRINTIDFVKMDIEGAESLIFNEDCEWLNYVRSINLEIHNGERFDKYINVLQKYNFTCKVSKRHWASILAYKNE